MRNPARSVPGVLKAVLFGAALLSAPPVLAQTDPFATGWLLQPDASRFTFQSVKQTARGDAVLELSSFAKYVGCFG